MRIIAGRYKGRSIKTIQTQSYRPTQSKIRKSLFDILGHLDGLTFLDLYAGSGIIGFEAASRGATQITFVEKQLLFARLLNENIQNFDENLFNILRQAALHHLRDCGTYDIIFADPPYRSDDLLELVKLSLEHVTENGRFILESKKGAHLPMGADIRVYGDTQLNIWTR
ncbi:MAG: 16S rRNA (guanine(966)-N(2))-methyltransferase RsmD [Candidatus Marinimicrobia bacterium]|nr:16S rRNA (guanine(966)-N(2))-methyltransferase RsmD [Candidatus Neomarinimicrobiota bacterium]MCH7763669.1 16S rRNA (guanine(966)-N(2))-methyltransferase RsmD [Candidatus Neomarinimicrobiota bacterium]